MTDTDGGSVASPGERPGTPVEALAQSKRLVLKVGSALLVGEDGAPNSSFLEGLAKDIGGLKTAGKDILIVTSGAIALGRRRLGIGSNLRLDESQAASAAGQSLLIDAWSTALAPHGVIAAQILLTLSDTENRRRYLNARATLEKLLALGATPVINENDTVATSEIRYGDNDRLAAHAAQLVGADLLLLLSDIDGLYTANPRLDASAEHLPLIEKVTPEIEAMGGGANKAAGVGSGGMETKIAAAKIAASSGAATIIAAGESEAKSPTWRPIKAVADGARASLFLANTTPARARKTWIRNALKVSGVITIDAGAVTALSRGASLLPAGVTHIEGDFQRGDIVEVRGPDPKNGPLIARGQIAYDSGDAIRAIGLKSDDIDARLGYRRRAAMIDRDDLVLFHHDDAQTSKTCP